MGGNLSTERERVRVVHTGVKPFHTNSPGSGYSKRNEIRKNIYQRSPEIDWRNRGLPNNHDISTEQDANENDLVTINAQLHQKLINKDGQIEQLQHRVQDYERELNKYRDGRNCRWFAEYQAQATSGSYTGHAVNFDEADRRLTEKLRKELQQSQSRVKQKQEECRTLNDELTKCKSELDDCRYRLSKLTAIKLTDENPTIADLSDSNRPTKLAEKYSELYDNQWSDAFEELTENGTKNENAINILLEILKKILETCEGKSHDQLRNLETTILSCVGSAEMPQHLSTHMKLYKEERKRNYKALLPGIRQEVASALAHKGYNSNGTKLARYIEEATDVCWLMCIQDPPMALDFDCKTGDNFDRDLFKSFSKSGKVVAFLVWPALRQYRGGPVISKGVAQCQKKKNKKGRSSSVAELTDSSISSVSSDLSETGHDFVNDGTPVVTDTKFHGQTKDPMSTVRQNKQTNKKVNSTRKFKKLLSDSNIQAKKSSHPNTVKTNSFYESRFSPNVAVSRIRENIPEKKELTNSKTWFGPAAKKGAWRTTP